MFFDKPCKACWWLFIVGVFATLGLGAFIIRAWDKVASGEGLDTYFTGWGIQFNYVGFLVVIAVVPVVLLLAHAVAYWERRQERNFKTRYGIKDEDI